MVGIGPHLAEIRGFENGRFYLENWHFCQICPTVRRKLKVGFAISRRRSGDRRALCRCRELELKPSSQSRVKSDQSWKKTVLSYFAGHAIFG